MNSKRAILGYSLSFITVLIILKTSYLFVESAYNTIVLDSNIIKEPTRNVFHNLEMLGHIISSAGLTLLVLPFLYKIIRFFNSSIDKIKITFLISICSILVFFAAYHVFTYLLEYVVKLNKDKRFESYYLVLLKNGISNNILDYKKIIEQKKERNEFSIEEKVILSNIFLTAYMGDGNVVDKMKKYGIKNIVEFYKNKKIEAVYKEKNSAFLALANKLKDSYYDYNNAQKEANQEYLKYSENSKLEFTKFMKKIDEEWLDYQFQVENLYKSIQKGVQELSSTTSISKWNKFVKNYNKGGRRQKKAIQQYEKAMKKRFGKNINPDRWCESKYFSKLLAGSTCMNSYSINKVVSGEALDVWFKKTKIPPDINTKNNFLLHRETKKLIRRKAKDNGLNLPVNYNYDFKSFKDAYILKLGKDIKTSVSRKIYTKTGIKNLKMEMSFKSFVLSKQVKNYILKEDSFYSNSVYNGMLNLIARNKTELFYKSIFIPQLEKAIINDIKLTREQLNTTKSHIGDDAIKALYIPPIAIMFSLVFGFLNLISLVSIILSLIVLLITNSHLKINLIKYGSSIILVVICFYLPKFEDSHYIDKFNDIRNSFIEGENGYSKIYLDSLGWLLTAEKYNYETGKKIRSLLNDSQLKKLGIEKAANSGPQ